MLFIFYYKILSGSPHFADVDLAPSGSGQHPWPWPGASLTPGQGRARANPDPLTKNLSLLINNKSML